MKIVTGGNAANAKHKANTAQKIFALNHGCRHADWHDYDRVRGDCAGGNDRLHNKNRIKVPHAQVWKWHLLCCLAFDGTGKRADALQKMLSEWGQRQFIFIRQFESKYTDNDENNEN